MNNLLFALSLYNQSRSAYLDLLKNIILPSTRALHRLTSKVQEHCVDSLVMYKNTA